MPCTVKTLSSLFLDQSSIIIGDTHWTLPRPCSPCSKPARWSSSWPILKFLDSWSPVCATIWTIEEPITRFKWRRNHHWPFFIRRALWNIIISISASWSWIRIAITSFRVCLWRIIEEWWRWSRVLYFPRIWRFISKRRTSSWNWLTRASSTGRVKRRKNVRLKNFCIILYLTSNFNLILSSFHIKYNSCLRLIIFLQTKSNK